MLIGGDGNDIVDGGRGNDVALLGAGDDTFVWNPGDGSDIVEGQGGTDTLLFNGANVAENIDISANGGRVRFVPRRRQRHDGPQRRRDTSSFSALGGADTITVNDLTGTDVTQVNIDLAARSAATSGDGQADTVIVNGTAGDDAIKVAGSGGAVTVSGLAGAGDDRACRGRQRHADRQRPRRRRHDRRLGAARPA